MVRYCSLHASASARAARRTRRCVCSSDTNRTSEWGCSVIRLCFPIPSRDQLESEIATPPRFLRLILAESGLGPEPCSAKLLEVLNLKLSEPQRESRLVSPIKIVNLKRGRGNRRFRPRLAL